MTAILVFGGAVPAVAAVDKGQESIIQAETNQLRGRVKVRTLTRSAAMDDVARRWATYMAVRDVFYHNPNYPRQIPAGWWVAGENIAYNYKGGAALYDQWYNSPGHYANMVYSQFTHIGIGVYRRADGRYYGVQVFGKYNSDPAGGVTTLRSVSRSNTKPKVTGTAQVGRKLTAKPSWSGYSNSYQWLRSGKVISGAKKSTYKLTSKDVGKKISVKVTGRKGKTVKVGTSSAYKVAKAASNVKASMARGGKRVVVRVAASGISAPSGRVTVRIGSRTMTATLRKGAATVAAPRLGRGTYRLSIAYKPNSSAGKYMRTASLKGWYRVV